METKPFTVVELITPLKAKAYLETSIGNRKVINGALPYAQIMKEGKWKLNGVPIIFDEEGHLMDGHNRLEAVVLADTAVKMFVTRGIPRDYFTSYDCGYRRTSKQVLAMSDVKNPTSVSSIITRGEAIKKIGKLSVKSRLVHIGLNNEKVLNIYQEKPELISKITNDARKLNKRIQLIDVSLMGGMMYYLIDACGYDYDYVYEFISMINSTSEAWFKPCDLLRRKITNAKINNTKLNDNVLIVLLTKCWNLYVIGKNQRKLTYEEGEELPLLDTVHHVIL